MSHEILTLRVGLEFTEGDTCNTQSPSWCAAEDLEGILPDFRSCSDGKDPSGVDGESGSDRSLSRSRGKNDFRGMGIITN